MTNNNHPITPPPELVRKWANHSASIYREDGTYAQHEFMLATQAARWGADMELEACCEWLDDFLWVVQPNHQVHPMVPKGAQLRKHRRPKPLTLKEQALKAIKHAEEGWRPVPADCAIIRRALESLPDNIA